MSSPLGDALLAAAREATEELLLVAPYIKAPALAKVLEAARPTVTLRVVTRWRLEELASGISDIAIWPMISGRNRSELWLQPSLHAKYYRADGRRLLGSANLTGAGLGWSKSPNLELLVEPNHPAEVFLPFEIAAFGGARRVDHALYKAFSDALDAMPSPGAAPEHSEVEAIDFAGWRPNLRNPHDLWRYYSGERETLTTASRAAAARDLAALGPPAGLFEGPLRAWVGLQLRLHPEFQAIEEYGTQSRRFGEMRALLASLGAEDSTQSWQTWMRWLNYFVPTQFRFRVANYSEIFETVPIAE